MWYLCPGGESQLHSDLQHCVPLLREPILHPEHQCWRTAPGPAFTLTLTALQLQHQPQWDSLQSCTWPCPWSRCRIHHRQQPWASVSEPELHPGEQGQWNHRWGLLWCIWLGLVSYQVKQCIVQKLSHASPDVEQVRKKIYGLFYWMWGLCLMSSRRHTFLSGDRKLDAKSLSCKSNVSPNPSASFSTSPVPLQPRGFSSLLSKLGHCCLCCLWVWFS